jgi:hypothetical protein
MNCPHVLQYIPNIALTSLQFLVKLTQFCKHPADVSGGAGGLMTAPTPQWALDTSRKDDWHISNTVCKSVMTSHCNSQSLSKCGPRHTSCERVTWWKDSGQALSTVATMHTGTAIYWPYWPLSLGKYKYQNTKLQPAATTSILIAGAPAKQQPKGTVSPTMSVRTDDSDSHKPDFR